MSQSHHIANPENVHSERSCLSSESLARWKGLPISWLEASASVTTRDFELPRSALAMIERGTAHAEFAFAGGRSASHDFAAGALGLFVPDVHFSSSSWRCQAARRVMVDLDATAIEMSGCGDDWLAPPLQMNTGFVDPELSAVLQHMVVEVAAGCPSGALYAQSLSLGLLSRLAATRCRRLVGGPKERGVMTPAQMRKIQELVHQSLDDSLEMTTLAAAAGLGVAHFARLFKNTLGCTPHQYVLVARVERAKQLIRQSSASLADIAAEVGFSSQSHMTAVFSRLTRSTPGEWRRDAS